MTLKPAQYVLLIFTNMKDLTNFSAYKLSKQKMSTIIGAQGRDKVLCQIYDEEGFSDILNVADGITSDEAQRILENSYNPAFSVECYDVHYVV